MAGALKEVFKKLVQEAIKENNAATANSDPEEGTVNKLNDDGTVGVITSTNTYSNVGTPVVLSLGSQVLIITADARKVAIPR